MVDGKNGPGVRKVIALGEFSMQACAFSSTIRNPASHGFDALKSSVVDFAQSWSTAIAVDPHEDVFLRDPTCLYIPLLSFSFLFFIGMIIEPFGFYSCTTK